MGLSQVRAEPKESNGPSRVWAEPKESNGPSRVGLYSSELSQAELGFNDKMNGPSRVLSELPLISRPSWNVASHLCKERLGTARSKKLYLFS